MRDWSLHLLDLMENSLRAEAKLIRLSIELFSDGVMDITLEDDGCGMAPDVVERAFHPFFSTKPAESGSGLGLATVYGFARQSGGNLIIESEPGAGTRVTLLLPAATRDA